MKRYIASAIARYLFVFLAAGAFHGQFAVIWKKAVMICLECIGIG